MMNSSEKELEVHMSLEEVIQRRRSSHKKSIMDGVNPMETLKMSLDKIIQKRQQAKAKKKNNNNASSSSSDGVAQASSTSSSERIGSDWNKSLDEIIKERQIPKPSKAQTVRMTPGVKRTMNDVEAEEVMMKSQDIIAHGGNDEEQHIVSPIDVIRNLGDAEDGLMIQQSIGINPKWISSASDRGDRWQSLISCGQVSVKVNATYKELARQGAAMGMIEILKKLHPTFPYPKNVKISEAYFYDLRTTVKSLISLVTGQGFPMPSYYTTHTQRDKRDFFITIVSIGGDVMQGSSYDQDHSILLAMRAAYETYAQRPLFRGTYKILLEDQTDEDDWESETLHTINISVEMMMPPAKIPRVSPQ